MTARGRGKGGRGFFLFSDKDEWRHDWARGENDDCMCHTDFFIDARNIPRVCLSGDY